MSTDYKHTDHFRKIAPLYQSLRITDKEPITYIGHQLKSLTTIKAADIGCGTGRYTWLLFRHLRDKLTFIYGIDYSTKMLRQFNRQFAEDVIRAACTINASAMCLPLSDESLNCIFTFNAIHHFALLEFLHETARILQNGGYLFIYTRLRDQNSRSVWGRFFPLFASKETRLYEEDELSEAITKIPSLRLQKKRAFAFNRKSNLERLSDQAKSHHYSTFDLYSRSEFKTALNQFHDNLRDYFDDPNNIRWVDENIFFTLQKVC
jgi:ubiquinone/menaquinone biosynthesis C-methylase UbiE